MKTTLTIACVILAAAFAAGSTTDIWMTAAAEDFARGKLENVTILSTGQLAAGMGAAREPVPEISIWAVAVAADGTAYAGTGNNGAVYRIGAAGAEKVFETGEAVVTSLAFGPDGTLYAGTIPGGRIHAWQPGGTARLFADLDTDYVWDMAYHTGLKALIVGTGPDGRVYTVTPDGNAKVFYDSNESHVLSLALDDKGHIFAGTSVRGVLFEFTPDGKVVSTWDMDEHEIRAMEFKNGSLFIAANLIATYERNIYFMGEGGYQDQSSMAMVLASRISQLQGGGEAIEKSFQELFEAGIYRLTPGAGLNRILRIPSRYACDIGVDASDVIFVATGDEGELWAAVEPNLGWVMMDLKEAQVLALGMAGGKLSHLVTGNAAAVYRTGDQAAVTAQYTSTVRDTGFPSQWGQIEWKSTGPVQVVTRTGNEAVPDATWSDWSAPLTDTGSKVTSPNARFVQFRIIWKEDRAAKVDWLRLAYINENQRPIIEDLFTARVSDAMPSTKGLPDMEEDWDEQRLREAQGKIFIEWQAIDPDGDNLVFWIYYRREGDKEWVICNPKDPVKQSVDYYDLRRIIEMKQEQGRMQELQETSFEWKTTNLADGWYMIKVVASDEKDNAGTPQKVWKEAGPVLIDNRKPEIPDLDEAGKLTWNGRAVDTTSHIGRVEYNLDDEKWVLLKVEDGIYDNMEEKFKIELKNIPPGEHVLTVRALDEGGNIGMRQVGFTIE